MTPNTTGKKQISRNITAFISAVSAVDAEPKFCRQYENKISELEKCFYTTNSYQDDKTS